VVVEKNLPVTERFFDNRYSSNESWPEAPGVAFTPQGGGCRLITNAMLEFSKIKDNFFYEIPISHSMHRIKHSLKNTSYSFL